MFSVTMTSKSQGRLNQHRRAGIDIQALGLHFRMTLSGLIEHLAKEGEGLEDVRLIDAG
jgi:hypothetical protein